MDRKVNIAKTSIPPSDRFNSIPIKLLLHLQDQQCLSVKNRHTLGYYVLLYCTSQMVQGFLVHLFVFYKLKARPSTSKKITSHFIVVSGT